MSLTVEQILNECREDLPQTFELEKDASVTTSSVIAINEVDAMVNLLKEASVPGITSVKQLPQVEEPNIYEKVAEAAILNSIIQTMNGEGVKLAEFREAALNSGFESNEIDNLLEKQAKASVLKKLFSAKNIAKGLAGAGVVTAAGAGGHLAGEKKQKKTTRAVGHAAFSAGRKYQYSRMRSLADRRQRLRDYLQRRDAQGKGK